MLIWNGFDLQIKKLDLANAAAPLEGPAARAGGDRGVAGDLEAAPWNPAT